MCSCLLVRANPCRLYGRRETQARPSNPVGHTCAHDRSSALCYRTVHNSAIFSRGLLPLAGRDKELRRGVTKAIDVGWPSSGTCLASLIPLKPHSSQCWRCTALGFFPILLHFQTWSSFMLGRKLTRQAVCRRTWHVKGLARQ